MPPFHLACLGLFYLSISGNPALHPRYTPWTSTQECGAGVGCLAGENPEWNPPALQAGVGYSSIFLSAACIMQLSPSL